MAGDHDRIAWLEADARTLAARLADIESALRSAEWRERERADAVRREGEKLAEESARESRAAHGAIRELRLETIDAIRALAWKVNAHTITVWALGFIALVEAGLILLLWIRR